MTMSFTRDVARELLISLPRPDTIEFLEKRVAHIDQFGDAVAVLDTLIWEESEDRDVRFRAFQIAAHVHRRKSNYSALNRLLEKGGAHFSNYKLFRFYDTQYRNYDSKGKSLSDLMQDAYITEDYIKLFPDYIGFKAHFAGIAIRILSHRFEEKYAFPAEDYLRSCIYSRPGYAHYHFLLGKLFGVTSRAEAGAAEIRRAIDLEDSESSLYYLRLQEYNSELVKLENVAHFTKLMSQVEARIGELRDASVSLKKEVEESGKKSIEFAGIFTLVISFLFLSIQSALSRPITDAILIIAFMGLCSAVLFASIKILFYGPADRKIAILMLLIFLTSSALMGVWISAFRNVAK